MPKIGFITPSSFKHLMSGDGKKWSETAISYGESIACEMFFGVEKEQLGTKAIRHGLDNEWTALRAYEERELVTLGNPGFTIHPSLHFVGGTPDGLVGERGGVDTKCPNSGNHYKNIKYGRQLKDYKYQFQGYMWIFGRDWWDMASYDPRYPEFARLSVTRIDRDEKEIKEIEQRVIRFWWEVVQKEISELKSIFPGQEPVFNH